MPHRRSPPEPQWRWWPLNTRGGCSSGRSTPGDPQGPTERPRAIPNLDQATWGSVRNTNTTGELWEIGQNSKVLNVKPNVSKGRLVNIGATQANSITMIVIKWKTHSIFEAFSTTTNTMSFRINLVSLIVFNPKNIPILIRQPHTFGYYPNNAMTKKHRGMKRRLYFDGNSVWCKKRNMKLLLTFRKRN